MTVALVGTSVLNQFAGAGTRYIALPAGSAVGDLIIVGFWPGFGSLVTDARLSTAPAPAYPGVWDGVAWGVATDLSDVEMEFYPTYAASAIVVVLSGWNGTPEGAAFGGSAHGWAPPSSDEVIAPGVLAAFPWCVAFVADAYTMPGDAAGWSTLDSASNFDGVGMKAYGYLDGAPVPGMDVVVGMDVVNRFASYVVATPPVATSRPWLRQRQSPKANVRVSVNRPQLRARQRFL